MRYRAVLEWDSDEPMDDELIDAVTAGLWVSVDDPSNAEGDGLHWSGANITCAIVPVEPFDISIALNTLRRPHHVSPDCWYTCPLAGPETDDDERNCDSSRDQVCDCGAAAHNEKIDALIAVLTGRS